MSIKVGDPAPPVTVEAYVRAEADPVTMELSRPGGLLDRPLLSARLHLRLPDRAARLR